MHAIVVEGLAKQYRIGGARNTYPTLRESLVRLARSPRKALGDRAGDDFWALRDVSFEVAAGEILGIVGSNGAGKSTLLRILAEITPPSSGRAVVRGRVGCLLEVGTGIHPELTGRENVFLNGAILGMSRREIRRKFDAIVAFAGLERFLDTPLKHYSGGMSVRLAFSVAAHVEQEILLVDEVLAVGDAAFQQRCIGKMEEVRRSGRTILFVSHNLGAVTRLCRRALLLEAGRVVEEGEAEGVVAAYLARASRARGARALTEVEGRSGERRDVRIGSLALRNAAGDPVRALAMGEALRIEIGLEVERPRLEPVVGVTLATLSGTPVHHFVSSWEGATLALERGAAVVEITVPRVWALPGSYTLTVWVSRDGGVVDDRIPDAIGLDVLYADLTGHEADFDRRGGTGAVYAPSSWTLRPAR